LLGVATRRARELGHGGHIVSGYYPSSFFPDPKVSGGSVTVTVLVSLSDEVEVTVLVPELVDVYRVLRGILDRFASKARRYKYHVVGFEFLPIDVLAALKKAAEAIMTTVIHVLGRKRMLPLIGALLVACDPRIVRLEAYRGSVYGTFYGSYNIYYSCKSPVGDTKLELTVKMLPGVMYVKVDLDAPSP
jgi:hypothetical protein